MLTALDALRRGLNFLGGNVDGGTPNDSTVRDVKAAIIDALAELGAVHEWNYLVDERAVTFPEPYDTGTIAYTATTRTLTLTSGTWPTWAAQGVVHIDNAHCKVERRSSSSVLILEEATAPSADVDAGTSYTLYRDQYPLPEGTQAIAAPFIDGQELPLEWIEPGQWYRAASSHTTEGGGQPRFYTVLADPDNYGRVALTVAPYPDQTYTLRFQRRRLPRNLRFWEVNAGTVAVTADGTTVTGTGTAFTSAMAGSIIRLSDDATNYPDPLDEYPAEEAAIKTYTSATVVDIAGTFSQTLSGVRYVISDPIDLDEVSMLDAFQACVMKNLARTRTHKAEERDRLEDNYNEELKSAKARDNRTMQTLRVGQGIPVDRYRWRRWR